MGAGVRDPGASAARHHRVQRRKAVWLQGGGLDAHQALARSAQQGSRGGQAPEHTTARAPRRPRCRRPHRKAPSGASKSSSAWRRFKPRRCPPRSRPRPTPSDCCRAIAGHRARARVCFRKIVNWAWQRNKTPGELARANGRRVSKGEPRGALVLGRRPPRCDGIPPFCAVLVGIKFWRVFLVLARQRAKPALGSFPKPNPGCGGSTRPQGPPRAR